MSCTLELVDKGLQDRREVLSTIYSPVKEGEYDVAAYRNEICACKGRVRNTFGGSIEE